MFVVIAFSFCCSSGLAFLIMVDLLSGIYSTEFFALQAIFLFIHIFFEKYCSPFGRDLCRKYGWAGTELCANALYRASLWTFMSKIFCHIKVCTMQFPLIKQVSYIWFSLLLYDDSVVFTLVSITLTIS